MSPIPAPTTQSGPQARAPSELHWCLALLTHGPAYPSLGSPSALPLTLSPDLQLPAPPTCGCRSTTSCQHNQYPGSFVELCPRHSL